MGELHDYETTEQLHNSARSRVYRAISSQNSAPVIVKILNKQCPSPQEIARFKREYAIARGFTTAGIVRPLALQQQAGYWTMLHEDIGGQSLDKVLLGYKASHPSDTRTALPLVDFFEIALQLCDVLDVVHGHNVIHKDINPANLVWNGKVARLQLIDFGISCELGQETQGLINPATLEGSLHYMAPEQTGRMNRIVDYRADFYALGATFYELLTGQPPFPVADAMELVHCHIARIPDWSVPALANLPGPLLAIVQRLLEKNAEQRYQSLHGLKSDLALCRAISLEPDRRRAPSAGLSDHRGKFVIPQKLVGRESEVDALMAAFERTSNGPSEMLLVAGYSGIGKSAVVNEVHKPMAARRGCFVAGKFDQYRRDVPYASLIEAFRELIRQLLGEPDQQVRQWADKLRASLGASIGAMVELLPELALIVGPTESVAELPPVESRNRLHRVFQQFVQVFSSAAHPLVLFLDDLQWADAPTLKMIDLFVREPDDRYLLVIGAYRDNEVAAGHPLMALCEQLRKAEVRLSTITLAELTEQQVAQLLAETLHVTTDACAPLTRLCYQKTRGNPFFLGQFLSAIHDAGHLQYRHAQNDWQWDLVALNNADYTDNVVHLMLAKIQRLPPQTRHLLQLAACVGNRVALETLAIATAMTPYQTQQALWPALQAGLIHPLDQHYKYLAEDEADAIDRPTEAQATSRIAYRFLHDRVQQAAYAVESASQRQANHLHIGRLLVQHATPETRELQLFAIAEQLNAGRALISLPAERLQLARMNLCAGIKARSSAAFQAALHHMRIGIDLLPDDAWQQHAELSLALHLGAAEAAYLCGEFAAADAMYPTVLAHCTTPLQQIRCITIQAQQYQLQGRLPDAIAILRNGLHLLQIDISDDPDILKTGIPVILAETRQLRAGRSMDDLLLADDMQDPTALATMQMMRGLWLASYYAGQQDLSVLMVLSMTRLSLQKGTGDFSAMAYVAYAFFIAYSDHDPHSHDIGAMALELANRRTDLHARSQTCLMFGAMINHWNRPLRSCDSLYDEAFQWALDGGDFVQVGVVAAVRATDRLIMGHYLPDLLESTERDLVQMRSNGQIDMVDCIIAGAVQPIKCLMGLTSSNSSNSSSSYDDDAFNEARFLATYGSSRLYQAYFYQGKIRNAYLFDSADAEALADHHGTVIQILRGQAKTPDTTFYAALIWMRLLRRNPQRADAHGLRARFDTLQAGLAGWVGQGNHDLAARHLLTLAELARHEHDVPLAMRHYREAIDTARATGYINIQALASEHYGEFWRDQGQHRLAGVFLQDAVALYRQWGADGKAAQLIALHADLQETASERPTSISLAGSIGGGAINAALDLASILKAALALTHETGLRNVLQRLIGIVRENSGAQVARLLLHSEGAWYLEADITSDIVSVLQARPLSLDAEHDPQFPLSLLRYAVRTGDVVIDDDIAISPRFATDPYVRAHRPRSVLCLPIKQSDQVVGMLYLENNLADATFTSERVEFLRLLGAQAMISIAHARLYDSLEQRVAERTAELEDANRKLATLSATDGLTGLANRRQFDVILDSELARARRTGETLVVMMIDVDHFKQYNDCYGHQAGDESLKIIARVLQAATRRTSDLAARYGGEEFSIVMANTDATAALQLADAMRMAIEELAIPHERSGIGKVTISAGVAVRSPDRSSGAHSDASSLLRVADDALYRAKDSGRNCVVMAYV
ncbi:diguanylate cyclase [Actimicrobium antarcticum]|uniref:diguanylate cyclase n=1 Tax=Actimicrobium antarcticum TaxID=1051899 RepID=UPI0031DE4BF7